MKIDQCGHANKSLPIHRHKKHPNIFGNQALKKLLHHPSHPCHNCNRFNSRASVAPTWCCPLSRVLLYFLFTNHKATTTNRLSLEIMSAAAIGQTYVMSESFDNSLIPAICHGFGIETLLMEFLARLVTHFIVLRKKCSYQFS